MTHSFIDEFIKDEFMPRNDAQPTVVTLRVAGDYVGSGEYIISSPSHPLYHAPSTTYPFDMCNTLLEEIQDVEVLALGVSDHLQPIWNALLRSGHFLMGQFGHDGVITVWAGGSTARCDVKAMLKNVNMPSGMVLQLENI